MRHSGLQRSNCSESSGLQNVFEKIGDHCAKFYQNHSSHSAITYKARIRGRDVNPFQNLREVNTKKPDVELCIVALLVSLKCRVKDMFKKVSLVTRELAVS